MQLPDRIQQAGRRYIDRIDPPTMHEAVAYVDFNQCSLAVEMICDHLAE